MDQKAHQAGCIGRRAMKLPVRMALTQRASRFERPGSAAAHQPFAARPLLHLADKINHLNSAMSTF